ncbi:hypothetical protein N7468_001555 [Penicillium chermesinum]|uniref:Uncharacterized protein n=1 Tax=Penicillium chermesinum TaxID=63820 RepID=A0A9W9PI50_9EURO|nr:uncharacterized protein N7468_001555 [Penicillium chermesinum]KAJ5246572.1 hypothetical protein N7468_001555 [Penicillium chermesinum]KAJ6144841.1 hypothetical protein N7470_008736 [Penicillium chermesinum]
METVNQTVHQVMNVASQAIWGGDTAQKNDNNVSHGEEPISGVQGKGLVNDPYDAGNRDEQPEAPSTDANTAPQEPNLSGDSLNKANGTRERATNGLKTDNVIAVPSPSEQRNQEGSSTGSQSQTSNPAPTATSSSAAPTPTAAASSSNARPANPNSQVSQEALRGPQGPAKYSAEQFERDEKLAQQQKRSKLKKEEEGSAPARSERSDSGGNSSKNSSKSSDGNGKTSPMAKVKQTLNKVTHRRGNSQKSTSSE